MAVLPGNMTYTMGGKYDSVALLVSATRVFLKVLTMATVYSLHALHVSLGQVYPERSSNTAEPKEVSDVWLLKWRSYGLHCRLLERIWCLLTYRYCTFDSELPLCCNSFSLYLRPALASHSHPMPYRPLFSNRMLRFLRILRYHHRALTHDPSCEAGKLSWLCLWYD